MTKKKQVGLTFLQFCRCEYLQSTYVSATKFQTFLIETHGYGINRKNNVTDEKTHEDVCHIKVYFTAI